MSEEAIDLDLSGAFPQAAGIPRKRLAEIMPALDAARRQLLSDAERGGIRRIDNVGGRGEDAAFLDLPDRTLEHYHEKAAASELGRMLRRSHRLRDQVDRVIAIGVDNGHLAAHAIMQACCEPYFNELTRGDRGSRPRVYFGERLFDNDAVQGLLRMVQAGRAVTRLEDRWAMIPIGLSIHPAEIAAMRPYVDALRVACSNDPDKLADLIIPITRQGGALWDFCNTLGCVERFAIPPGVVGTRAVFSACGLLPAAILGVNVVRLLEGAIAANDAFRDESPDENRVLQFAGTCLLWRIQRGVETRAISVWSQAIESVRVWYDQLLMADFGGSICTAGLCGVRNMAASDGKPSCSRTHSPQQMAIHWIVEQCRTDPIPMDHGGLSSAPDRDRTDVTLPMVQSGEIAKAIQACLAEGQPVVNIRLPDAREHSLGQFMQFLMLTAALEKRVIVDRLFESH